MRPGERLLREYYEKFETGVYVNEVDTAECALYTPRHLKRDGALRLRRDLPPFLFAGRIDNRKSKIVTGGINPKAPPGRLPPANFADYAERAYERFAQGSPSEFHNVFLRLISGIVDHPCVDDRTWVDEHYATIDLFCHHSSRFSVSSFTAKRVEVARSHFDNLCTLLSEFPVDLLILNGAPYRKLLVDRDGPMLVEPGSFVPAAKETRYGSVIERTDKKKPEGHALVGTLKLHGRTYATVILGRFIHQARPPLDPDELRRLGAMLQNHLPQSCFDRTSTTHQAAARPKGR